MNKLLTLGIIIDHDVLIFKCRLFSRHLITIYNEFNYYEHIQMN